MSAFATLVILATSVGTYAFINVQTRPEFITVSVELPVRRGIVTMWDPVDPEVGLGASPDWYVDYEGQQRYYDDTSHIFSNTRSYTAEEHVCLAKNIYFEARHESLKGQLLVALVTLERLEDRRWPSNNLCDVIYEDKQFSWYSDGLSDNPKNMQKLAEIALVTSAILSTETSIVDFTENATHYHADYVSPKWADGMVRITKIGYHIAYRDEPNTRAGL